MKTPELVLKRALIYDGTGRPPIYGDIAIYSDYILAMDAEGSLHGMEELECKGLAVAPGFIDTQRLSGSLGPGRRAELARTPAGRLGTPEEVAATVAFLASHEAGYFVGATLSPNGGLLTAV